MAASWIGKASHENNNNLPPPYNSPNYPDWPDWQTSGSFYDDYALYNHDTLAYPWVIFFINHMVANRTDSCVGYRGGYSTSFINRPRTSRVQRYSFVVASDVQLQGQLCAFTPVEQENMLIHAVTHEYGHQRAGLTDWFWEKGADSSNYQYHQGPLPTNREDVMASPETEHELTQHPDAVFDGLEFDFSGDYATCKGNLLTNSQVH